jgi:hypothetical protein
MWVGIPFLFGPIIVDPREILAVQFVPVVNQEVIDPLRVDFAQLRIPETHFHQTLSNKVLAFFFTPLFSTNRVLLGLPNVYPMEP